MQAELEKLANSPPDAVDRKHALSLILGYLGSSLKGVHEERDYLAEDPEIRVQVCIARAVVNQLQAPALSANGQTREWGHVHCSDDLRPYKKLKEKIKDLMRLLGLRFFVCPEPLLSPSDYAALFNANIVVVSPASFIEQMAIILQFQDLNPFSLFNRRFTLSCDLDAGKPVLLEPPKKFRLFPYDESIAFIASTGRELPGRSFHKPVAPKPLTGHAELNYRIDFMQFAAGIEWSQRYLPADSPLLASSPRQNITNTLELSSRMLGELWITAPGYFDPRNFSNNVSAFMDKFGLDVEQKGLEEIEREMPQVYRETEKSLISLANMMEKNSHPLSRLIDFHFQRDVSSWMRTAYWQELSKLWQQLNRFTDSRCSGELDAPSEFEDGREALTNFEGMFKNNLRDRLLESPFLAPARGSIGPRGAA